MSTTQVFERLAVVGMGLLGGSVALSARANGLAGEIRGVDPQLDQAGPIPLVGLEEAARWADGVVLAVPVDAIETVLKGLAPLLTPGTILTDTASVKEPMARLARAHLREPDRCVGAHPMAGGDVSGFHQDADARVAAPPAVWKTAGPSANAPPADPVAPRNSRRVSFLLLCLAVFIVTFSRGAPVFACFGGNRTAWTTTPQNCRLFYFRPAVRSISKRSRFPALGA